jgi:hypothetical protein
LRERERQPHCRNDETTKRERGGQRGKNV